MIEKAQAEILTNVANALGELQAEVIYVGGAIVGWYGDNPAAETVRPTKDVDIVTQIHSLSSLETLRLSLKKKGFIQSHLDKVICRFRYGDILVDVMNVVPIGWAPGNRWFEAGIAHKINIEIEQRIFAVLPAPYFLATKFDAFKDRGGDPRMSTDFEDIIYILHNRTSWSTEIMESDESLKAYLLKCLRSIFKIPIQAEGVLAHLPPPFQYEERKRIFDKIGSLLKQ